MFRPALLTARLPYHAAALTLTLVLAGCGSWFGAEDSAAAEPEVVTDPRPLVADVLSLKVDAIPSGAIIRATGLPVTQGYWSADLVARPLEADGTLVFDFRILPPLADLPQGSQPSREVTAAVSLTNYKLRNVSRIVVQGKNGSISAKR